MLSLSQYHIFKIIINKNFEALCNYQSSKKNDRQALMIGIYLSSEQPPARMYSNLFLLLFHFFQLPLFVFENHRYLSAKKISFLHSYRINPETRNEIRKKNHFPKLEKEQS